MRTTYQERRALGCRVQLALVGNDPAYAEELMRQLWLEILYFEKRCSRFLPDSELSQLNRLAGSKQFISPEMRRVLQASQRMSVRTGGLYNPFVLPALQRAGYVGTLEADRQSDVSDDFSGRSLTAADRLEVGDDWMMIPYGTALDLGGCGKGYIGDCLSDMVKDDDRLSGYWFSIGGDTVLDGVDADGRPWTLYLQPDPKRDDRIGEVNMLPGAGRLAVATSSTRYRAGEKSGKRWSHIIDPRTGRVTDGNVDLAIISATSLLVADVLATCVLIAGSDAAPALLDGGDVRCAAWQAGESEDLITWREGITPYASAAKHRV